MNATRTANTGAQTLQPKSQVSSLASQVIASPLEEGPGTRTGSDVTGEQRHEPARVDEAPRKSIQPPELVVTRDHSGLRSKLLRIFAASILIVLVGAGLFRWWSISRCWVKTDNAYLAAHIHTISPRAAGTVEQVAVEENQRVTVGEVLARLDPNDFEVKREQARAQLAQARAQLREAEAQIAQARAQVAREQARAVKSTRDLVRAESLYQGSVGAISKAEFEQAQAESDAAQASVQATQSAVVSAEALAGAAQAHEKVAQANVREAELQLSYTILRAPATGRIGKRNLETGNQVQPGQALLALVQPDVWVTANFKETQLTRVKTGQLARIRVDAFPGQTFLGCVDSISPASGAQFALLPPDNATGNFTKIVQRVPVKILLERGTLVGCEDLIAPGMSAVVEIKVGE